MTEQRSTIPELGPRRDIEEDINVQRFGTVSRDLPPKVLLYGTMGELYQMRNRFLCLRNYIYHVRTCISQSESQHSRHRDPSHIEVRRFQGFISRYADF